MVAKYLTQYVNTTTVVIMKTQTKQILVLASALIIIILAYNSLVLNAQTAETSAYSVGPAKYTATMTKFTTLTIPLTIVNKENMQITITLSPVKAPATYPGFIAMPYTTWVTFSSSSVTIARGTTKVVNVLINIPKNSLYVNKHYEVWILLHEKAGAGIPITVDYYCRWMVNTPVTLV